MDRNEKCCRATEPDDDDYVNTEELDWYPKAQECTDDDDDYVNTEDLNGDPKPEQCTEVSDRTEFKEKERKPTSSKRTVKLLMAALCLLLLGALTALCVLGILYHNKAVSINILSEQYANAALKLQEQRATANHNSGLCEEGWRCLGLKCYYFSNDELDWMQSRDYCVEKGGHLVIITSQTEQDFVSSKISETHWIGLNDLETEGKWMWVNNEPLKEMAVTFWFRVPEGPNEPDNWRHEDISGENCAALGNVNGDTHKWFDASCSTLKKCICEK